MISNWRPDGHRLSSAVQCPTSGISRLLLHNSRLRICRAGGGRDLEVHISAAPVRVDKSSTIPPRYDHQHGIQTARTKRGNPRSRLLPIPGGACLWPLSYSRKLISRSPHLLLRDPAERAEPAERLGVRAWLQMLHANVTEASIPDHDSSNCTLHDVRGPGAAVLFATAPYTARLDLPPDLLPRNGWPLPAEPCNSDQTARREMLPRSATRAAR